MRHPPHHEPGAVLRRPRPHGRRRRRGGERVDECFGAGPVHRQQLVPVGRPIRLHVCGGVGEPLGNHRAPEVVHLGDVPQQVRQRPLRAGRHRCGRGRRRRPLRRTRRRRGEEHRGDVCGPWANTIDHAFDRWTTRMRERRCDSTELRSTTMTSPTSDPAVGSPAREPNSKHAAIAERIIGNIVQADHRRPCHRTARRSRSSSPASTWRRTSTSRRSGWPTPTASAAPRAVTGGENDGQPGVEPRRPAARVHVPSQPRRRAGHAARPAGRRRRARRARSRR